MGGKLWPWLLLAVAFLPALLIHQARPTVAPVTSHVFTEVIFENPGNLDPALASSPADWQVSENVFQTLLDVSSSGAIVPGIASSATFHGRVVNIQLRHVRLSNGKVLSADTVAEALARPLTKPVNSAEARKLLADVVGTTRYESGSSHYVAGIAVTGSHTLSLTLKTAASAKFLANLANPALAVVPPLDQAQGGSDWQFTNLTGTGGYLLSAWTPGNQMNFGRVSGSGPQAVDLVLYQSLKSALLAFRDHLVNAIPIAAENLSRLTAGERRQVQALAEPGSISLYLSHSAGSLALPGLSIPQWVSAALYNLAPAESLRYPRNFSKKGHVMTLWVNGSDSEALQLAQTLAKRSSGHTAVKVTSAANLKALAASGAINAYLGRTQDFHNGSVVPIAPVRSFWLFSSPMPRAAVFPHQALSWHSVE